MSPSWPLARDADLAAAVAWLALAPVLKPTVLAGAVALGALLMLPGYALVAALFLDSGPDTGPPATERLLVGVAASVETAMGLGIVRVRC